MSAPAKWFVTTQRARTSDETNDLVPVGVKHAKTWGSVAAACGAWSYTWPKFWDIAFTSSDPRTCPACAERLLRESGVALGDPNPAALATSDARRS